jgi:hypothetical protein
VQAARHDAELKASVLERDQRILALSLSRSEKGRETALDVFSLAISTHSQLNRDPRCRRPKATLLRSSTPGKAERAGIWVGASREVAQDLANFMRALALPEEVEHWC